MTKSRQSKSQNNLGSTLKRGREEKGLSQMQVAQRLGLSSPQSVSDWERNHGSLIPMKYAKKLVPLYGLAKTDVFHLILDLQWNRLKEKLTKEFWR